MNIKLLFDHIAIRETKPDEKTSFGLVLPGSKNRRKEGVVEAVGPGRILDSGQHAETQVKLGSCVVLRENIQGEEIEIDGRKLLIVSEQHILAIIKY